MMFSSLAARAAAVGSLAAHSGCFDPNAGVSQTSALRACDVEPAIKRPFFATTFVVLVCTWRQGATDLRTSTIAGAINGPVGTPPAPLQFI